MKRRNRILLAGGAAVLVLALAAFATLASGVLVRPTAESLAALTAIPSYDVLDFQAAREQEILADYEAAPGTPQAPYVVVDPYGMNPCSALAIFEVGGSPTDVAVTVEGDGPATTFTYKVPSTGARQEVPLLYLYAGRTNHVLLAFGDGTSKRLDVATEPLPVDFQVYALVASEPDRMEPGLTLCTACFDDSYTALIDADANVRGYLSHTKMAHGTPVISLRNGHLLATGDEYRQIPYNMTSLWEFDWLGKVFREYEIPNGIHHSLVELPDGNFLAASNAKDLFASGTREDVAVVVDRTTGAVAKEYDFRKILDDARDPYNHFNPGILNATNVDWMHMNSVLYDAEHDWLIVSSPIQSQVVAIDAETGAIQWILGPHDGYTGSSARLAPYLLDPVGSGFAWSWGQHGIDLLPDQDGDPDTMDLLMLDNGQARSFTEAGAVPAAQNHSRGVQYRIRLSTHTVEQVWEYGADRGSECYATFLGDADFLPTTGNRLIDFGGQLRVDGKPVDEIIQGVLGTVETRSRIVEVDASGRVVFEVSVQGNAYSTTAETYQAERVAVPAVLASEAPLGTQHGVRLGTASTIPATQAVKAPGIFAGGIAAAFSTLVLEHGRLVVDGSLTWKGRTFLLGRAYLVLRSGKDTFVYPCNSGLNGRFFSSIDTTAVPSGEYQVSVIGAVREGNDAAHGPLHQGFAKTEYKLVVP